MEILHIILTSLGSLLVLFLLAKLMGSRQIGQMSMFDYINSITIGSIAAEFATSLENDFLKPLTAMVIYALATAAISFFTCKSIGLRRFFNGRPIVLFEHGKLYEKNLLKAKLDINEFLMQCRTAGYFDLAQIGTAVLETNGQISFQPLAANRPVTPEDLQLEPNPETPAVAVILDGKLLEENLKHTGNNLVWLRTQLEAQHAGGVREVFLATVNTQNVLTVYLKTGAVVKRDMFE